MAPAMVLLYVQNWSLQQVGGVIGRAIPVFNLMALRTLVSAKKQHDMSL